MNKALILSMTLAAGTLASAADKPKDWTNILQDALTVYKSDTNVVRKVKFAWMEQFQMAAVHPNGSNGLHLKNGATPFNCEFRRSWVGLNVDFSTATTFHTWVRIGGLPYREKYVNGRTMREFSYTDFFDIWLKQDIAAVKGLSVKAGKIKPLFSTDYSTPSSQIFCLERSLLGSQYGFDSNWGIDVTYAPTKEDKVYLQLLGNDRACNSKSPDHRDRYRDGRGMKGEFGWEDKFFGILGAEHKFAVTENGYQKVSAQYLHDFDNTYSESNKRGANYYGANAKDAISVGYEIKRDKLTFISNAIVNLEMNTGSNQGNNNNIGLQLQPIYSITPHVDLIARYVGMTGHHACKLGGDRYITRQTMDPSWVDSVHTFYFGADFYASAINKNALKFMLGAEYTTARSGGSDCYNGWEYSTAVRWNF